ncbi:MAG: DMT family transporter [Bacteroidia bacterium]|nr:DMT family transporter [Bacteroidia bacterium]
MIRYYIILHVIVFIWGFTPVLGKFITLDAWQLVWWRMCMIVPAMFAFMIINKKTFVFPKKKHLYSMMFIGTLIAFHWVCFYGAIKVSNISITMAAFSSATLFTSLIEPIFYKRKIRLYELLLGVLVMIGISIIFSVSFEYKWGLVLGLLAALLSSIFSVLNSLLAKEVPSVQISTYELFFGWIVLSIYLYFGGYWDKKFFQVDTHNWIGLSLLSYICTTIPFIVAIDLTRHISPYTINLTVNMESIYGIILGMIFYKENKYLSGSFYIGFVIILCSIFLNAYLQYVQRKKLQVPLIKERDNDFA